MSIRADGYAELLDLANQENDQKPSSVRYQGSRQAPTAPMRSHTKLVFFIFVQREIADVEKKSCSRTVRIAQCGRGQTAGINFWVRFLLLHPIGIAIARVFQLIRT